MARARRRAFVYADETIGVTEGPTVHVIKLPYWKGTDVDQPRNLAKSVTVE